MRRPVLVLVLLLAACAGPSPAPAASAASSPSAQPSATAGGSPAPSPTPTAGATAAYGVLAALDHSTQQYTISIVGADGRVVASAKGTSVQPASCLSAGFAQPNPALSTSNSRVYYMDGGTFRWLAADGGTGSLSLTASANAYEFSVSPDDARIAVVLTNYTTTMSQAVYVGPLNGPLTKIYETTDPAGASSGIVPVGWHGGNIVFAYYPQTCTQGGGPGAGYPREYHIASPLDAHRIAMVGGRCAFVGAPSPAGVACGDQASTSATVFDWSGASVHLLAADPQMLAFGVSVLGDRVAMCCAGGRGIQVVNVVPGNPTINGDVQRYTYGWIDDSRILIGADGPQDQALVWDLAGNKQTPVAAQGDFRGRIPGTLDPGRGTGTGL